VFYTILNEEYNDLSTLYWIPKLHKNPFMHLEKGILPTGSSTCSAKMSITMTKNSVYSPRGITVIL